MSEREEKLERMLSDIQSEYTATLCKLEKLKQENKTKTATYKQLLGNKLMLHDLLYRFKIYGLLD